jgi:hypothetical protein
MWLITKHRWTGPAAAHNPVEVDQRKLKLGADALDAINLFGTTPQDYEPFLGRTVEIIRERAMTH